MDGVHCKLVFAPHSIPLWEAVAKVADKGKRAEGSWLKMLKWRFITCPREKWFPKYDKPFIEQHKNCMDGLMHMLYYAKIINIS